MVVTPEQIKSLRDKTGLSVMLIKRALETSGGDETCAFEWLRKQGIETAEKKSVRATKAGLIEAYIHAGQVGVMIELKSETDFVAKNPLFKEVAHNIAMHIAAANSADTEALLKEQYIKNPEITIADYLNEVIQKFGEKIEISRFTRFEI